MLTWRCAGDSKHYGAPDLLVIDVGYPVLLQPIRRPAVRADRRRYQRKSTMDTTNRALKEWHEVFPNAACVVSLIDRLRTAARS
ncbi:MAG: ATP-binding protein [Rhodoferax sp.]|nr:ATP-binding protein [Rhodoferax sp.]